MPNPDGTPTAEELRQDNSLRQGLSTQQLINMGLSNTEAQTIGAGFTGSFGNGTARAFREGRNLSIDASGNVITDPNAEVAVDDFVANQVTNPTLAGGTIFTPVEQQVNQNELLNTTNTLQPEAPVTSAPAPITNVPQVQPTEGTATTVDTSAVDNVQAQTVASTLTQAVDPLVAAELEVRKEATLAGQIESLFGDFETGNVPKWAVTAFNAANEEMAARGITSSTISSGAITQAFLQSAIPIASQDAQTYFQADLSQFNADNQAALTNFQARQQNMLTDTSIANATKQFNASSIQQTQQFTSQLITQIQTQNADRLASMEQFNIAQDAQSQAINAGNTLQAEQFSRQQELATTQFNAQLKVQRDQFNSQMRFAIDQSNVLWRRSVNTANTAAQNAANATNVQNMFNMSQTALNNVWQQYRDEAAWLFEASENQANRDYNLAVASGNRDYAAQQSLSQGLGSLATDFVKDWFDL